MKHEELLKKGRKSMTTYEERLAMQKLRYGVCTHTHTQRKRKFTDEQIAEFERRQLEINFEDYEEERNKS